MTVVSHRHRLIFLKTRKTAGSSVEQWLADRLGPADLIKSGHDVDAGDARSRVRGLRKRWNRAWGLLTELKVHMAASDVRALVGRRVWSRYLKITIERDPWDRMLSMWRWRQHRDGISISLDDYLTAVESEDFAAQKQVGAAKVSNWSIYTIDDEVIVDRIMRYENLDADFADAMAQAGIPFDGDLPRLKSGIRAGSDTVASLTQEQIERITALFPREIALLGYEPPAVTTAAQRLHSC